ncbi:MAG TPA: SAF domain-containing protein [Candidatus Nanopelagicales bacterium]
MPSLLRSSRQPAEAPERPADLAPVRARRRPWLIATGALLASVGALAVVWLVGAAGQRTDVLVLRQEVAYGEPIEVSDLGIARVSVDPGVAVLPAAERDLIVGQVATTRLLPGTLVTADMVAASGEPTAGRVLVPIAVPAERMPAGGLRAGDRILAVDAGGTTETATGSGPSSGLQVPAAVVRVGAVDVNGVTVVDVTTNAASGPQLAIAAANGRVAIVVQPSGG